MNSRANWHNFSWTQEVLSECFYIVKVASTVHWDCGVFFLGDSQKPSRKGSEQSALGNPSWAWVLDQKASGGPFQPQPFVVLRSFESQDSSEKPSNYLSLGDQKIKWLKMCPIFWGFCGSSSAISSGHIFLTQEQKNKVSYLASLSEVEGWSEWRNNVPNG